MKFFKVFSILLILSISNSLAKHEDCEKPPEVENSSIVVSYDENEEFVTAAYRCHEGFRLKGKSEITCDLDTDEWQESPPTCEQEGEEGDDKSSVDNKKRRKNKVHEIKEETQISLDFAQHLDLSCMSKGLVKAPNVENGFIAKYNRRRKGEKLFLVAFYECDEDFELENLDQDRLYCSREKWVGDTPKCLPVNDDGENGEDEEDYSDGNGNVSGGESEDEKEQTSTNEIPSETHHEHHREIEKSTTEAPTTPQSRENLTLPCDSDRGGCEHDCQMLKYYFDSEPTIQCSCYEGFLLDENDGRRCHDIDECSSDHGCEQICNNLPGSFECACHPGLQIDSTNNKKCIDVNECLENPSICGDNKCENTYGTYTCIEQQTTTTEADTTTTSTTSIPTTTTTTSAPIESEEERGEDEDEASDVEESDKNEIPESEREVERSHENEKESDKEEEEDDIDNSVETVEKHETVEIDNEIGVDEARSTPEPEILTSDNPSSTTEVNHEDNIEHRSESEHESVEEDDDDYDERRLDVEEEKQSELHHQSSTVKSDVRTECDDGLRLDGNGKCVGIDETTIRQREEESTPIPPHQASTIQPECQHVDGEGVECHCPYGYELSEDESFCQDINECEIYDNGDDEEGDEDEEAESAARATFCSHTCTNLIGSFICSCPENFHIHDDRRTCVRDYCVDLDNAQLNKTKCSHDCVDEHEGFSCRCPSGSILQNDYKTCKQDVSLVLVTNEVEEEKDYEDNEVEGVDSIVECSTDDHEHCSPGSCIVVGEEKECSCPSGFTQKSRKCVDFDECEHGTHQCSHSCHNTEGSFRCSCPNGLKLSEDGKTCDDYDECSHDEEICGTLECHNTYGSYKCICRDGEEIDEHGNCRRPNLCERNNGGCSHSCRSHHDEIVCECPDEMDLDEDLKTCINADPCHVIPNGGCSHFCDSTSDPICFCPPGYTLDETELVCEEEFKCGEGFNMSPHDSKTCIDIDECAENHNVCSNGHCENTNGSFVCRCHHGYELSEHNRTCLDIDECAREVSPCSHRCLNLPGSYQCGCPYGQVLIEDGHTCGFQDLCDFNNGGCAHECDSVDNKILCSCRKGYKVDDDDEKNCVDVDECRENNGGCQHSCVNNEGSFDCSCHDGYELHKNGFSCGDIDECVENNGNCSNICINLIGSHICACEAGFMLGTDNLTCQDVDECKDLHDCSHICINTEGTYECACPNGFILGHDKFNCHDINECLDSPCIEGHCVNTIGSFHCQCNAGFELSEDGAKCVDKNECLDEPCTHHCLNTLGGFNCSCPEGMQLSIDDATKCEDIDECELNSPCSHICENTEKSFICKCPEGFVLNGDETTCSCASGLLLSSDKKSCVSSDPCSINNGGCSQLCEFSNHRIVCSCRNGFEIDSNDWTMCSDINECKRNNTCQQQCVNTIGSFRCDCFPGFRTNENDKCIDIDECKSVNFRCPQSSQCINTAGSYKCICPDGFKLSRDNSECIEIKNECKPLTVKNGEARCTRSRHKTQLFYRTKCAISCDKGFKLHGPSIKHCNGTGHWDDMGDSTCHPIACPRLAKPDHGTILPANCMHGDTFSGERCFLHCPSGYKALGKRVAVCNNLQWHPRAELQCVPVRAPTVQLTSVAAPKQQLAPIQHQRATIKCPEDITIVKPKNQDTILVRIPKPETNVDWNKYVDSQPMWAKRLEATLSVGASEVTFRARSPSSNQFDICRVIINVVEPSPPTVTFCPEPFVVNLLPHELSRPIFWDEATFESKHPIKQIFKSKVPGHRFGPGVHPITYVASTLDGLSAKCNFRITVKGHEMPVDHSQKIALETNTITDSYDSSPKQLENHESFLMCPGQHPIKIGANQPWHLPRGCVIKNVKVQSSRNPMHPPRRERPLRKQHQPQPQPPQENVVIGQNENFAAARNNRKNNRLRLYSLWDGGNSMSPAQQNHEVHQEARQLHHHETPIHHQRHRQQQRRLQQNQARQQQPQPLHHSVIRDPAPVAHWD